ncbi:HEPN domain-containing protein [Bacillus inaquosorum]|uniref:HEPN domain-containing protein n=1 Tax=Bacillus inaquosorum TaxID=483913 RepID=UPI002281ECE6|nr:HEPN domain-containing protein [Bacillus inaquosorum]MCY8374043.1 HEPN domain-containing protein [Bacillus inaquosorum]MCY9082728.1 HEPN domain-containing protein [Bacillus inaquosorum]MEC0559214.1 HEPN domain-containing protein [Bacillus inaquosorum]
MDKKSLKVEYLVFIDTGNAFCSDADAFNNLLKSNSEIRIDNDNMLFRDLTLDYKVQMQNSNQESKKFFHITLQCNDIQKMDTFDELLRLVRDILYKVCKRDQLQRLWDDVSYYYSCKAYPLINELENLMRKLITKFMLTNVGLAWAKHSTPKEVKDSVKGSKIDGSIDYLYNIDFIQLTDYLFKTYSPHPNIDLFDKLKEAKQISELELDDLKSYIPKSNWERYFSGLVQCEASYLEKKWKKLYELRNKVAHNNFVNKSDYEEISKNCTEVKQILESAIGILDQVHIPEEDKDVVADNVGSNVVIKRKFVTILDQIRTKVNKLIFLTNENINNTVSNIDDLVKYNILRENEVQQVKDLFEVYNNGLFESVDEVTLDLALDSITDLELSLYYNFNH